MRIFRMHLTPRLHQSGRLRLLLRLPEIRRTDGEKQKERGLHLQYQPEKKTGGRRLLPGRGRSKGSLKSRRYRNRQKPDRKIRERVQASIQETGLEKVLGKERGKRQEIL